MQKVTNKQTAFIIASLVLAVVVIKIIVGGDEPKPNTATATHQEAPTATKADTTSHEQASKEYAARVKLQLQADLKTVDVHLADEGSLKWLFVTISLAEWQSLNLQNKKDLAVLLIRQMKTRFPNTGLKVSIGIDADQPLAEADWSQLSDAPEIKILGE